MGYRSEVYLGVRKKHKEEFEKLLEKHDLLRYMDDWERNHSYTLESGQTLNDWWVIYSCEDMKWYDTFDDVSEIMDFIENLSELDGEYEDGDGFSVCLGEDGAIHSENGVYWHYVDVIRTINII